VSIIVGVSPDESGADAVALGAVLSRLLDRELVLVHVHPTTIDYPSVGNVDAEWEAYLVERSRSTLETAQRQLEREWGIASSSQQSVANSSVGRGLAEIVEKYPDSLVVLGPGTQGREAHVFLSSAAHSLLHGGQAAVALAPEGYRETAPDAIERLVVGVGRDPESAVTWARAVAHERSIALMLMCVVLRVTRIMGSRLGRDPERAVIEALVEQQKREQQSLLSGLDGHAQGVVLQGDTAEQAMGRFSWQNSDLLILGSSRFGVVRRVLLGDTGLKILRASTVPTLVLPR